MQEKPRIVPRYVRVVGGAMLLWGVLGLASLAVMVLDTNSNASRLLWALECLLAVGGLGLLLARRWGWPLTLLEAIVSLAIAIPQVARYRGTTALAGILLQIVLSALILVALLTPRSLAWLRAERGVRPAV
jgi:hypothetical protein